MLAEPYAAHRPHSVAGCVHGGRAAPEVGVVVGDPSVGIVIQPRSLLSVLGQVLYQMEERGGAFRKVGDLGGPVVHLSVDVQSVFAAPVGKQVLAPASLEVAGLAALAAAGNGYIAAELEELGLKVGVLLTRLEDGYPLIRGLAVLRSVPHGKMDAAHEA